MNKSDLVKVMSERMNITAMQAERAVNAVFDTLTDGLAHQRRIELRRFGSFSLRERDGYLGRNPKNGETVNVAPKRFPHFKPGKEMKAVLNDK